MEDKAKIRFFYIKSNFFRVIQVTGAHGGISPRGGIFAALFNERAPIPQVTTHNLSGELVGEEITEERQEKQGIVREVEVGITMDLQTAETFHKWLGGHIAKLKEITGKQSGEKT